MQATCKGESPAFRVGTNESRQGRVSPGASAPGSVRSGRVLNLGWRQGSRRVVVLCVVVAFVAGTLTLRYGRAAEAARARAQETAGTPVRRAFYGRRLEPREPVVLHGGGTLEESSFWSYSTALGSAQPMLFSSSVDLHEDLTGFFARLQNELQAVPFAEGRSSLLPQISVSFTEGGATGHYEDQVGSGSEDRKLRELIAGLRSLDRPVFLRLGYDFNDPNTGYRPAGYVAAYRRAAREVRDAGLNQVALVWDWSPDAELDLEEAGARERDAPERWLRFYPGDDAVDWWGLELFSSAGLNSTVTARFLDEADKRGFPVMIGESTPRGHDTNEGNLVIEAWFRPYFRLIAKSPMIKAFCYLDRDWRAYPQWTTWGDARIEADPQVLHFVREELSRPLYAGRRSRESTESLLGLR